LAAGLSPDSPRPIAAIEGLLLRDGEGKEGGGRRGGDWPDFYLTLLDATESYTMLHVIVEY